MEKRKKKNINKKNENKYVKIKQEGKVPAPLIRRPAPAPYFHPLSLTFKEEKLFEKTLLEYLGLLL